MSQINGRLYPVIYVFLFICILPGKVSWEQLQQILHTEDWNTFCLHISYSFFVLWRKSKVLVEWVPCYTHDDLVSILTGFWGYLPGKTSTHKDYPRVCGQGVHLRICGGDGSQVDCLWIQVLLQQCLVLAWFPHCRCKKTNVFKIT